jgi:integrase/recombinase XerD
MNTLRESLQDYVAMRRSLGFKLEQAGKYLLNFVSFLEGQNASFITTKLAVEWAQQPSSARTATWAGRLSAIRGFAVYRQATDSRTEIPPSDLLPTSCIRMKPYLYTDEEIARLMHAALEMPYAGVLTRRTYCCFFGLLAVSGMRPGEVIQLKVADVDLAAGLLTVKESKFGKSRLIPLHDSTKRALAEYAEIRDKLLNRPSTYFFISSVGTKLSGGRVRVTFYQLSRQIGLRGRTAKAGPRLQDFRHRFAVETLSHFYRDGEDAEHWLPVLSTYLGHASINDTYWYLSACPQLMEQAVHRLEQRWEGQR